MHDNFCLYRSFFSLFFPLPYALTDGIYPQSRYTHKKSSYLTCFVMALWERSDSNQNLTTSGKKKIPVWWRKRGEIFFSRINLSFIQHTSDAISWMTTTIFNFRLLKIVNDTFNHCDGFFIPIFIHLSIFLIAK